MSEKISLDSSVIKQKNGIIKNKVSTFLYSRKSGQRANQHRFVSAPTAVPFRQMVKI